MKTRSSRNTHSQDVPSQSLHMIHSSIVSADEDSGCLDSTQLKRLEESFREWADNSRRQDTRLSRRRVLLIFLLIRYTGAKLNEVLALNPFHDIDTASSVVTFNRNSHDKEELPREVQLSASLSEEIAKALTDQEFSKSLQSMFDIDPAFIRRKFYERAEACGFIKTIGGPEMIRKARAVELMQHNMPLPVVQTMLGHSSPNLTSSYVSFSLEEMQQLTKRFMDKESAHKTSARNAFYGKIKAIRKGDIQTLVDIVTLHNQTITTIITNDSRDRLMLHEGVFISAEIKAPWILIHKCQQEPECSAENRFPGTIRRLLQGKLNTECVLQVSDDIELCALLSTHRAQELGLQVGDRVWAVFNSSAVVLRVD